MSDTQNNGGSPGTGLSLNRQTASLNVWGQDFERAQRMASALSSAALFPQNFKDVGSCLIVLEFAQRLGMSPFEVAQNIDLIHGKPSWKSSYILQCIADQYEDYEYEEGVDGKVKTPDGREIDNRTCKLVVTLPNGKRREGATISYRMAIEQGWWGRKDSKWPSMGEQMLIYRAAAFFDRKWPSGRTFGVRPVDEVQDIESEPILMAADGTRITPAANGKTAAEKLKQAATKQQEVNTNEQQPEPAEKPKREPKPKAEAKTVTPPTPEPVEPEGGDDNPLAGVGDDDWS